MISSHNINHHLTFTPDLRDLALRSAPDEAAGGLHGSVPQSEDREGAQEGGAHQGASHGGQTRHGTCPHFPGLPLRMYHRSDASFCSFVAFLLIYYSVFCVISFFQRDMLIKMPLSFLSAFFNRDTINFGFSSKSDA